MYDYKQAIKEDIKNAAGDYLPYYDREDIKDAQDLYNTLYDDLFVDDAVTGNASGSYTFNKYQAGENLAGNFDLSKKACYEFGFANLPADFGEEWADVTIRCYLLFVWLYYALCGLYAIFE